MSQVINDEFLSELFKAALINKNMLELIIQHIKYEYLPDECQKNILKRIVDQYELSEEMPTIGSLSQFFSNSEDELKFLHKIKNSNIIDKKDIIISTFEAFLVKAKFIDLYSKVGTLYNEGKQEKAIDLLANESALIKDFTIKDAYYTRIFSDYLSRVEDRKIRAHNISRLKIPYSIHALDYYSRGGMNLGTSTCVLGRSGTGKSSMLRWIATSAARMGFKVVLFGAEGTEQENLDMFDACWTGINLEDMEFGDIAKDKVQKIEKANRDIIASGGEVFVKCSESFDEMSINDCKDIIQDLKKIHGDIHLAAFDYAELFTVKGKYYNSESGERKRREDISNKITSISTSENLAALTATQANDIRPDKWNNPDFVMTRSDISEFKGFIKPFANFITINSTMDEYENGFARLYTDKFRKAKSGQTIRIAQAMSNSRFYDSKKTLNLFWDDINKINK